MLETTRLVVDIQVDQGQQSQAEAIPQPQSATTEELGDNHDIVNAYLNSLGRTELLNGAKEEAELARRIEEGWFAAGLLALRDPDTCEAAQTALLDGLETRADMLEKSDRPAKRINHAFVKRPMRSGKTVQPSDREPKPYEPDVETRRGRENVVRTLTRIALALSEQDAADMQIIVQEGEQAFGKFIDANRRLAADIALHSPPTLSLIELIQEANLGLIRAVEKFDYTKGYKFSTYATWWIRQTIHSAINNQSHPVRIPNHAAEWITDIKDATNALSSQTGQLPSAHQIAEYLNAQEQIKKHYTAEEVLDLLRAIGSHLSLDASRDSDDPTSGYNLHEVIAADNSVEDWITRVARAQAIEEALVVLPPDIELLIRMRFGFSPFGSPLSQSKVAEMMGIAVSTLKKREAKALKQLKKALADEK